MAGYSGKPLNLKLGMKPGCRMALVNAPETFEAELEPLPENVSFLVLEAADLDIVLLFCTESEDLIARFPTAIGAIKPAGMIWIAWPKKASKAKTDLDDNSVREIGLATGLVDVKVCAVDDYWSGLKFVRRVRDR